MTRFVLLASLKLDMKILLSFISSIYIVLLGRLCKSLINYFLVSQVVFSTFVVKICSIFDTTHFRCSEVHLGPVVSVNRSEKGKILEFAQTSRTKR